MAETCSVCIGENSGEAEDIFFGYNGFKFRITKSASVCERCGIEVFLREFRKHEGKFIAINCDGKLIVDWRFYSRCEDSGFAFGEINLLLLSLGVLSYSAEGNWEITTCGSPIGLNPKTSNFMYVYFIREEDALSYAKEMWAHSTCKWEIRHIDCVIPKAKALEF